MGLTFKENCPDLRNSGIKNVINNLKKRKCKLDFYDPWVSEKDIKKTYGRKPIKKLVLAKYDGIIIAVAHDQFKKMGIKYIKKLAKTKNVVFDLKSIFKRNEADLSL